MDSALRVAFTASAVGLAAAYLLQRLVSRARCVLYVHPISQPSNACLLLVRAARVPPSRVIVHVVALEKGEHKSPEFLAINPSGAVPALTDGASFGMGESHAILRFLCERLGLADHWYPREPHARARVDEYLDWHHSHTRRGVPYFFHKYMAVKFNMTPDTLRRAEGRAMYESAARHIESCFLSRSRWVGGEQISIADLSCYAELGPMQYDDELGPMLDELPQLSAWLRRMSAQPWHDEVMSEVAKLVQRGQ